MEHPLDRRTLLKVAAAATAGVVSTPTFARAADGDTLVGRVVFRGKFTDPNTPDWVYLPFRVPKGTSRIRVHYDYQPTNGGPITTNVVDIGIFDASGHELGEPGSTVGFRGWSGGARRHFSLSRTHATPGYLAGPLRPGVWVIALGPYQINGRGTPYEVVVDCEMGEEGPDFVPHVSPQAVPGTGPGWYRGDLHTHTIYSDGRWTQPTLLAAAKAAGLDFLGTSEHNTSAATYTWGRHVPDDFLVIDGEEVTTRNGHWVATGLPPMTWIDWRYRAADDKIQAFADQVRELGGVTIAAHPDIIVPSIRWDFDKDFAEMDAVEVWNGPWTVFNQLTLSRWDSMLKRGVYKPGVGNSDSHHEGQTVGLAHNVMRMDSLSAASMVAAVKGGHLWVTGDAGVDLAFTASLGSGPGSATATCGETLAAGPDDLVTVTLTVSGVPASVAQLHGPAGVLAGAVADAEGAVTLTAQLPASALAYVRADVRRPKTAVGDPTADYSASEMLALTNPVFVELGTTAP